MTKTGDKERATLSFREALTSPVSAYRAVQFCTNDDLDTTLTKILLDYKRGRQHQAAKRFENLLAELGFDTQTPLIRQSRELDENTASLLIFELLFMFKNNITIAPETLWEYVDSIAIFDPDDVPCHGAIYNLMLVFFLRNGDLSAAYELAKIALNAYRRCGSDYLQMFIHLHIAYIHVYAGRLTDAEAALDDAQKHLVPCGRPVCETAMVAISRYWVQAEAGGGLPRIEDLQPLGEQITEGEFWPETFLVLAALHIRVAMAEGQQNLPDQHGAMEFTLRNHGLLPLLPAMQLLREEFEVAATQGKRRHAPLGLPERQLVLLLPTVRTWRLNSGEDSETPTTMPRLQAVKGMHLARHWRDRGRFDLAMEHFIRAMEIIQTQGYGFLNASETGFIAEIARECRKRGRFVEIARGWLNRLGTVEPPPGAMPQPSRHGLTPTELGVLQRLPASTSNKALALALGVSESTVKFHLKNVYRKLGVHRRRDAIDTARAAGLL